MIDFKRTLLNLHKTFPEFDLDTIIKIIECITTETSYIDLPQRTRNEVTCKTSTWNSIIDGNANLKLEKGLNPYDNIKYDGPKISSVGRGTLSDEE